MMRRGCRVLSALFVSSAGCAEQQRAPPAAPAMRRPAIPFAKDTLIHAELATVIDATTLGDVEAIVTRDVLDRDGLVWAPTGSRLACTWRRGERDSACEQPGVELLCHKLSIPNGEVSMRGYARLRIINGRVPRGTKFLFYLVEEPGVLWR
jgi:hypothetical protein